MQSSTRTASRTEALAALVDRLGARKGQTRALPMLVPDILVDPVGYECRYVAIDDASSFLLGAIDRIQRVAERRRTMLRRGTELGPTFLVDLRSYASIDGRHGSFLSLLPWLASWVCDLACRNIVLLPLGPYGMTRRKGTDGSLFALTDHLGVAEEYRDPLVPELSASAQYRAIVELAASAGVRVGTVQPLATAALDCPAFALDPSLTFWWVADPGEVLYAPLIEDWLSAPLAALIEQSRYRPALREANLSIPKEYAERFVEPPPRSTIRLVHREEGTYFVGKSNYKGRTVDVAIANAIPDVIPDTAEQYAWRDIGLLNYWRTLVPSPCMLMGSADIKENSPAMERMTGVMRARSRRYGESVFWIDMARCLPPKVRNSAPRSTRLFDSTKLIFEQVTGSEPAWKERQGAVVGEFLCNVAPRAARRAEFRERLFQFLSGPGSCESPAEYLAGPGTHDALPPEPRIAALLMLLASILPGAQPLLVSGQEQFVAEAINAEFGELGAMPYGENVLSLFSRKPDRALSGMPVRRLADEHNLPPASRLLAPVAVVREQVWVWRRVCPPRFALDDAAATTEQARIGRWTVGKRPAGPWCSVLLRIDDGRPGAVRWEEDWAVMLRPMTREGWAVERWPSTGTVDLASVDLAIVGGRHLDECWRMSFENPPAGVPWRRQSHRTE